MTNVASVPLTFDEDTPLLDYVEFSHFLYLFRLAYVLAVRTLEMGETSGSGEAIADALRHRVADSERAGGGPGQSNQLFFTDLRDSELAIERLSKHSPLEIVLIGIPVALTAAVILSGGEIEVGTFKAKLRPIGIGVRRLREALNFRPLAPRSDGNTHLSQREGDQTLPPGDE